MLIGYRFYIYFPINVNILTQLVDGMGGGVTHHLTNSRIFETISRGSSFIDKNVLP